MDEVTEDQCSICSSWPAADRAERGLCRVTLKKPIKAVCDFCEFRDAITVKLKDQEELDAWVEAVRQERRKPPASRRHGHEILQEIRSKTPNH